MSRKINRGGIVAILVGLAGQWRETLPDGVLEDELDKFLLSRYSLAYNTRHDYIREAMEKMYFRLPRAIHDKNSVSPQNSSVP